MKTTTRRRRLVLEPLEGRALLTAGALDPTFGGTGTVTTEVSSLDTSSGENSATGLAVQSDLKTVVVGTAVRYYNKAQHNDIAVVRYNVDGSLDTTFGSGGFVYIPSNGGTNTGINTHGVSVQIQPDGKIVVAGTTVNTYGKGKNSVQRTDLLIARLNPNGSYDTTFNGNGEEVLDIAQENLLGAGGLVLQPDGKIVVATNGNGGTGFGLMAVRVNANGGLDTSFGPNGRGYASVASGGFVQAVAIDGSGNILVGGEGPGPVSNTNPATLVRYTPTGQADTTFGPGGEVQLDPTEAGSVYGIGFQSTGQIVVSATIAPAAGPWQATVARFDPDGTLDTTFGNGGSFVVPSAIRPYGLVIQPNDEIVVASQAIDGAGNPTGFDIARITANGQSLDSTFGNGGQTIITFGANTTAQPAAIVLGPDGNLTVAGGVTTTSGTTGHYSFGIVRLDS